MQKTSITVLANLNNIRENPPSPNVSVGSEVLDSVNVLASLNESKHMSGDMNIAGDSIDWDITLDSSQIDWDIGTVEETEDNSNELASYEIVNASDIGQSSSSDDAVKSDQAMLNKEENMVQEVSVSDISWDISVENPQIDVIEDSGLSVSEPHASRLNTSTQIQENADERCQFLETEYRSKVLDDLFEVYSHCWLCVGLGHIAAMFFISPVLV